MKAAAWVLAAAAAGLYICGSLVDVDLWWHIAVGRWIIHHQALPSVDLWNYYSSGEPWRAYSWTSEVLYAWLEQAYGMSGLLACKAALSVLLAVSLCWSFSLIARDAVVGCIIGIVATSACYAHFVLRPQTVTWILFALVLMLGELVRRNGVKAIYLFGVLLVFAAWANTHLSAIVGICYLLVWVANFRDRPLNLRPVLFVFLAAVLGTLMTPYAGGEWLTLLGKFTHPLTHRNIVEFRAATFADYPAAFLILFLILLLRLVHERPSALELPTLAAGCMLAYGSLAVLKFLPYGAIALCALIARYWSVTSETFVEPQLPGLGEALMKLRGAVARLPSVAIVVLALIVVAEKTIELSQEIVRPGAFPEGAVTFLQEHGLEEQVSNVFGDGGYLIYRFSSADGNARHKVVLDGRTNVNADRVVEAYQEALYGRSNWKAYLDFGSGVVLWRSKWPLASILEEHPDWCRVYFDGGVSSGWSVFVRMDKLSQFGDLEPSLCKAAKEKPV